MKHFTILFTFIALLFVGVACTPGNLSYTEAQQRNERKLESNAQRDDAKFLVEAANYNLIFTALSNRAAQEGYARIVVDFANNSLADHQRLNDDLKKLSKDKKIALPATMSERYQELLNDLTVTDKRAFDKRYLNTIENLHERTIRLFEEAALQANDSNIRAFAASKLDMIRSHERKADELERQLL